MTWSFIYGVVSVRDYLLCTAVSAKQKLQYSFIRGVFCRKRKGSLLDHPPYREVFVAQIRRAYQNYYANHNPNVYRFKTPNVCGNKLCSCLAHKVWVCFFMHVNLCCWKNLKLPKSVTSRKPITAIPLRGVSVKRMMKHRSGTDVEHPVQRMAYSWQIGGGDLNFYPMSWMGWKQHF
jgi:hypothetical protein